MGPNRWPKIFRAWVESKEAVLGMEPILPSMTFHGRRHRWLLLCPHTCLYNSIQIILRLMLYSLFSRRCMTSSCIGRLRKSSSELGPPHKTRHILLKLHANQIEYPCHSMIRPAWNLNTRVRIYFAPSRCWDTPLTTWIPLLLKSSRKWTVQRKDWQWMFATMPCFLAFVKLLALTWFETLLTSKWLAIPQREDFCFIIRARQKDSRSVKFTSTTPTTTDSAPAPESFPLTRLSLLVKSKGLCTERTEMTIVSHIISFFLQQTYEEEHKQKMVYIRFAPCASFGRRVGEPSEAAELNKATETASILLYLQLLIRFS